ncbi:hypothetical protein EJ069_09485 [Mesorhizobium sp. M2A.F.Ca.ET.043.05.1.1]|uniref:hypothetical protein n=1 Tax=Mesorhizobium sp. M2A.F.Ca.ET.043.05.1.1 TaxID=2493671 RepID=UPI000F7608F6|nr:hypothetical protein [Mesorhizobium sp. M2A.F.Ca.ET.043.05.1.1]AZO14940.1 hypothetical protein EJ069_09485 [Mesorhizobium sp. M2A.F.Ca.ET.043.05.1.1]
MSVAPKVLKTANKVRTADCARLPGTDFRRFFCKLPLAYASAIWAAYSVAIGFSSNTCRLGEDVGEH